MTECANCDKTNECQNFKPVEEENAFQKAMREYIASNPTTLDYGAYREDWTWDQVVKQYRLTINALCKVWNKRGELDMFASRNYSIPRDAIKAMQESPRYRPR